MKWTLEANICDCHPDECSCDPWVIMCEDMRFITVFDKERGNLIVTSMNIVEGIAERLVFSGPGVKEATKLKLGDLE